MPARAVLALVVAGLALAGCSSQAGESPATSAAPAALSASVDADVVAQEQTFVKVVRKALPLVSARFPNDKDLRTLGLSVCILTRAHASTLGISLRLITSYSLTPDDADSVISTVAGSICLYRSVTPDT